MNKIILWYMYILYKMMDGGLLLKTLLFIPVTILLPYVYLLAVLEDLKRR